MDGYQKDEIHAAKSRKGYAQIKSKAWSIFKQNIFLLFLLCGIISGVIIGVVIKVTSPEFYLDERNLMYIGFPGDLLLRMLKCMIIPLIVTSLISGMASIPGAASGRLGVVAILYYNITTFFAVCVGILLVVTIRPGDRGKKSESGDGDTLVQPVDSFLDLIR